MRCPFFEEVVVAYCRAFPIKKMVPSDRLQTECTCTGNKYEECSLFQEVVSRIDRGNSGTEPKGTPESQGSM